MVKKRKTICPVIHRQTNRSPTRRQRRRLNRTAIRSLSGRYRRPDELAQALAAYRRAITCHRRLARLAPEFFDATTVNRAARFREEQRRWMASWQPALEKVYGPDSAGTRPLEAEPEFPRLPGPRTQRAVERELAALQFWLAAAGSAMDLHRQRRPHALPTLNQLGRLMSTAFELARLAVGEPAELLEPEAIREARVLSDLRRAYGHRTQNAPDCESPSAPAGAQPVGASETSPSTPVPADPVLLSSEPRQLPGVGTSQSPAIPSDAHPRRCDAWSRWARQLCRAGR